ncbi:MAG TPA: TIM-barrel domain-containing protein [Blastocatellia bacterium]|nr:TIM-barrel domain-containing protein [Blastocatellia bacterium]
MSIFPFVAVNGFTPNNPGWSTIGNIDNFSADPTGRILTFHFGQRALQLQILGRTAFRVRFNPAPAPDYSLESSVAVVNRDLGIGALQLNTSQPNPGTLVINTGALQINVALSPFAIAVFRGTQLIHKHFPGQGLLYIPGAEVIAVMNSAAPGAVYVGCGEKAGSELLKNAFTFNFFNFDNFSYNGPALGQGGPLNPTEPLYCSIPLLVELNPFPQGEFAGDAYANGIFLDNGCQSFVNVSADDYSNMSGKYYLGALYNELDYYVMAGNEAGDVLQQYTTLTGRSGMPPRYVFGLHQGAYGYYDRFKLSAAANSYRAAQIPCDGLHIDVDFQNNYRTFTHSEMKFPNAADLFGDLHQIGFKMSTNITPILTTNELDESGARAPFVQRDNLVASGSIIFDTRFGEGPSPELYEGGVNYGINRGSNPYPYPPLAMNRNGEIPLSARGNYPDFGRESVRESWGQQYSHLINDLGLDMIWQDMTCPAIDPNLPPDIEQSKTFAQDLMMALEETGSGQGQTTFLPNAKLHNLYVLNLLRATWNGVNALRSNRRNFIIARGGYAGMQRYAALWTGDSASSWEFLSINIPEVLNLGLSGVPISGCDIGGFAVGSATTTQSQIVGGAVVGGITNYELLTRWMQLGSFLPWFRNHYDGYNKQFQEPYAYGEPVPTNCREYVELRYRMIQIYYDAMYKWTQAGTPIARALFLNDPRDPVVYQHLDDQFFVGEDFLVAPLLQPHETANPPSAPIRSVYLPAGSDWYAFMDNKAPLVGAVPGGTLVTNYFAGLDLVPIYVRAGAILPFCELEQWIGQLGANPLTFNCYPGPDRWSDSQAYTLYQDDGVTNDYVRGASRVSRIYQRTLNNAGAVT